MSGEPQDSISSSGRPDIESLRSSSDQHVTRARYPQEEARIRPRREHSDGEVTSQITNIGSTRPYAPPPQRPLIPPPPPPIAQSAALYPPRTHSLSNHEDGFSDEARRRAMVLMLRQRRDYETRLGAGRSRASSEIVPPEPPTGSRRHATSFSAHNRSGFPASSYHTNMNEPRHDVSDSRSGYVVPAWQPDAEVSNCPICGHAFSFFYRKHHCRKCGRVVCASCSPHRITIPTQYIVNPPPVLPIEIDLTGDSTPEDEGSSRLAADHLHPSLNGGQEVRLCNPCVPDPNPLPPPPYPGPDNNIGIFRQQMPLPRIPSDHSLRNRRSSYYGVPWDDSRRRGSQPNPLVGRRVPLPVQPNPLHVLPTTPYGSAPNPAGPLPPRYTLHRAHRPHNSVSIIPTSRHRAMFEAMTTPEAPPESPPRRQIAEEDECPICHEELPPKGLDGSELNREAHISACIEGHFSSSRSKDSSMPRPETAIAAAVVASAATPAQAGSSLPSTTAAGPSTRRRTTGMVVYNATEKDCIGEDGKAQECIICFEDFEPGVEMGRLECLCKFHKACIRSWWDTKGVGACPVHQGGLI